MKKLRVAIVGLGMAAGHHARALADLSADVEVTAVYSPTDARRAAFSAEYGFPAAAHLAEIFDRATADAVLILTPPNSHLDLVAKAAAAGQHIVLEKPLEISLARAREVVATAEAAGVLLAVVLQNRFRSSFTELQTLLRTGQLGAILEASMSVRNWRSLRYYDEPGRGTRARDGGGVLLTQAIHTIDLFLELAGTPTQVVAHHRTTPIHRMECEDLVSAVVAFENGAIGTLSATTCAFPGYPERIELVCTQGTATLIGDQLRTEMVDGRTVRSDGESRSGFGSDPMAFGHELHRRLLANVVAAVTRGDRLAVDGHDALRAHAFIEDLLRAG